MIGKVMHTHTKTFIINLLIVLCTDFVTVFVHVSWLFSFDVDPMFLLKLPFFLLCAGPIKVWSRVFLEKNRPPEQMFVKEIKKNWKKLRKRQIFANFRGKTLKNEKAKIFS